MEERQLNPEIVISADGSHTLRVDSIKEHYHSHKGALQESLYVFLDKGLNAFFNHDEINLLEVGFGTGLNALLTALNIRTGIINYHTLETDILDDSIINRLNYPELIKDSNVSEVFKAIHTAAWNETVQIQPNFALTKWHLPLQKFLSFQTLNTEPLNPKPFNLIYYDAFAPHAQPELWTPEIWNGLYDICATGAVLVTYCAKGQVRRDMQGAGWKVEKLPGPPGKREMIRARKP